MEAGPRSTTGALPPARPPARRRWLFSIRTSQASANLRGAEAIATARGWTCAAGHEHVTAEARHAEGWEYAECYDEAKALAAAGVEPLTMSGHLVTGPQSFAPTYAA